MPWFISMLLVDLLINYKKVFLHLYPRESMLVLIRLTLETNLHLNGISHMKASQYGHSNISLQARNQPSLQTVFVNKIRLANSIDSTLDGIVFS